MVLASYVRETASAYTDLRASETNRSDGRCATVPIPERRLSQKATGSNAGNNSIGAGRHPRKPSKQVWRPKLYPLALADGKQNDTCKITRRTASFFWQCKILWHCPPS